MARRDACWRCGASGKVAHAHGCRPGRPRCKYRRPVPCDCPAYRFPHRASSGICGDRDAFAAKVYGPSVMKTVAEPAYAEAAAE